MSCHISNGGSQYATHSGQGWLILFLLNNLIISIHNRFPEHREGVAGGSCHIVLNGFFGQRSSLRAPGIPPHPVDHDQQGIACRPEWFADKRVLIVVAMPTNISLPGNK